MTENTMHERLWTPWRMRYINGQAKEDGCIFCNRLRDTNDVASLILHRGVHSFAIMNLFPYNTGHIMILPNKHAADPSELDPETLHEMADLLPILTRALRRVLNCEGFNVGINIGTVAGAGVAEHLHQHVVPRWLGDANFMPILASTTAIPELIPSTYAKVRAEIAREVGGDDRLKVLLLLDDDRHAVLQYADLPVVKPIGDESLWRAAMDPFRSWVTELEVAGWAGDNLARPNAHPAFRNGLVLRGHLNPDRIVPEYFVIAPIAGIGPDDTVRAEIAHALSQLAPSIAASGAIDRPEESAD
jgi:ATP adenylyltransferase